MILSGRMEVIIKKDKRIGYYLQENIFLNQLEREKVKFFLLFKDIAWISFNARWNSLEALSWFFWYSSIYLTFSISPHHSWSIKPCFYYFSLHRFIFRFQSNSAIRTFFLSLFFSGWIHRIYFYASTIRNLQLPVCCFHSRETRFPLRLFW